VTQRRRDGESLERDTIAPNENNSPWNNGVQGTQVLPLINDDAQAIRVQAGPGTGKTFGLARRVVRILHANGLDADGSRVLVVAFNRVIAQDLRTDIARALKDAGVTGKRPVVQTLHSLCLQVLGAINPRLLLPHEQEAMLYDVRARFPSIGAMYGTHRTMDQALRNHEAGHEEHTELWQAVQKWLTRHRALLISDVPRLLAGQLKGGDFTDDSFDHVIVDEFQDLTASEQELVLRLRSSSAQFVALGDPLQSIYFFRGNDREGLRRLDSHPLLAGIEIRDIPLVENVRCPQLLVEAGNQLMKLEAAAPMVAVNDDPLDLQLVHWKTPKSEASGMADYILASVERAPDDKHLVMVTRRQFGYLLRDALLNRNADLPIKLAFSEGILELWPVREAFIFFCLLVDPDPPTWRAWLGYKDPRNDGVFKAPDRNAPAYLALLKRANGDIDADLVREIALEARSERRGSGGGHMWDRASRHASLLTRADWPLLPPAEMIERAFDPALWVESGTDGAETAERDLALLRDCALSLLEETQTADGDPQPSKVAQHLRHRIATREAFAENGEGLAIATLWGAKGLTADHVYVLGLCDEAVPGWRPDDYPGTDNDHLDEQRRLFYVTITRAKHTTVLSRPTGISVGDAKQLNLRWRAKKSAYIAKLHTSRYLVEIMNLDGIPDSESGDDWVSPV
jgi:DNA helicase-2/ATP-dependent DNA helicase PcrA